MQSAWEIGRNVGNSLFVYAAVGELGAYVWSKLCSLLHCYIIMIDDWRWWPFPFLLLTCPSCDGNPPKCEELWSSYKLGMQCQVHFWLANLLESCSKDWAPPLAGVRGLIGVLDFVSSWKANANAFFAQTYSFLLIPHPLFKCNARIMFVDPWICRCLCKVNCVHGWCIWEVLG